MNKIIDLHIHSNFSEDADLSIEEIFNLAQKTSISAISITDHDSILSIDMAGEIAKNYPSIEYVPGFELTTVFPIDGSQQHILGYYINNNSPALLDCLEKIKISRIDMANKRIEAIQNLNFSLDEKRILEMTGDRPSTALSIMLELFNNENNLKDKRLHAYLYGEKRENKMAHFYKDYFSKNGPAYVPFELISCKEGIDVIKKAGGIAVIAHPIFLDKKEWLNDIAEMGIQGIEAISTYHDIEERTYYLNYAEKHKLLVTAGSDFHGPTAKPHIKLGDQEMMDYSYYEILRDFHNMNN